MASEWQNALLRWRAAELIDPATGAAIEAWEAAQPRQRLRAPIVVCLVLGAVLLAAGVLLFVAAHWDNLPPGGRFALVLSLVVGLHGLAAWSARGFPALAVALHGVGSVALGGGIFLVGQIFHLETHWPAGLLLWAIGAGLGWLLLGQWPQLALLALLTPIWLVSEWLWLCQEQTMLSAGSAWATGAIPSAGVLLLSLAYLCAPRGSTASPARRVLLWIGGLALIPATLIWTLLAVNQPEIGGRLARLGDGLAPSLALLGWSTAIGGPLLLGWWLRGRSFWPLAVAAGWILASVAIDDPITPWTYGWHALGGLLLVAWGLRDSRSERVNVGIALVGLTVMAFYFAEVMGKLERSLSLIGLGLLCLLGGWGLEWLRRRMLGRIQSAIRAGAANNEAPGPGPGPGGRA